MRQRPDPPEGIEDLDIGEICERFATDDSDAGGDGDDIGLHEGARRNDIQTKSDLTGGGEHRDVARAVNNGAGGDGCSERAEQANTRQQ